MVNQRIIECNCEGAGDCSETTLQKPLGIICKVTKQPLLRQMITSIFEDGYSWIEFTDEAWAHATQTDYFDGIPILFSNKMHKFI